jgi:small GTP-binding protein
MGSSALGESAFVTDPVALRTTGADVLSDEQRALVNAERALLADLRSALEAFDRRSGDVRAVSEAAATLDELFLLVVVGEFNAGKSSVINALVGERVAPEGILPTTVSVTMFRYGDARAERSLRDGMLEIDYPAPFLRHITIVDTPGTNAIIRKHEEITEQFAPRADLALFVTSADRPFTESERSFIERLRGWGKPVVAVLNKTDLLTGQEQIDTLAAFIRDNARLLLGFEPQVIAVSARLALQALEIQNEATRRQLDGLSGFAALRTYVFETLDETSRLRLKLENPLGIAESVLGRFREAVSARESVLAQDAKTEAALERQVAAFREDILRDFGARSASVDNTILEMNARASRFFETTIRLSRIPDLINTSRVKEEFARDVVADSAQRIDDAVRETIDWAIDAQARLWTQIADFLARHGGAERSGMIGSVAGTSFAQDRRAVLNEAVRSARCIVEASDRKAEGERLAASMRDAVAQTGLVSAGAMGLGVVVVAAIGGATADITGILAGAVLAGLGLYIIPARRRSAQQRFERESEALREKLGAAMREQFTSQLDAALSSMREALAPYLRFVRTEREHIAGVRSGIDGLGDRIGRLRSALP